MLYLNQGLGLFPLHSCHLGPHLGLLLYGYLFPENSGTRRLGKDSAKHAVKPKPRSWNRHLHLAKPLWLCALCHGIPPARPTALEPDLLMWWGGTEWEYSVTLRWLYPCKCCSTLWMFLSPCFPLYWPPASHVCVASASVRLSEQ